MKKADRGERKRVVLIVDDETDMATFLSTLVKVSGYDPVLAKNCRDGIRMAREVKPDLLILDVIMPGEGGILLYERLRKDPDLKRTPVIMLSAVARNAFDLYLSALNIRLDESLLPEAYIEKPPDADGLMELIKSILDKTDRQS